VGYSKVEYELSLHIPSAGNSVSGIAGSAYDFALNGFMSPNLYGGSWRSNEAGVPENDGAIDMGDSHMPARTINIIGEMWGDDPDALGLGIESLAQALQAARDSTDNPYIQHGRRASGALVGRRLYGVPGQFIAPIVRRTRYHAARTISIAFRLLDPGIYADAQSNSSPTMTSGSGTTGALAISGRNSRRLTIQIFSIGTPLPTNVVVSNGVESFTLGGSLAIGDKWFVDCYHGTVIKTVSGVATDDIGNFTGQFLEMKAPSTTITITDGGTAAPSVSINWLLRYA